MTADVATLHDASAEPDRDTVETLKYALAMAERGDLRSVAIIGAKTGHRTFSSYATHDLIEMVGMLRFLEHTLLAKMSGNKEPD